MFHGIYQQIYEEFNENVLQNALCEVLCHILCSFYTDTLGVIMRTAGKANMQLAEDCLKLAMTLINSNNSDPDRKRAALVLLFLSLTFFFCFFNILTFYFCSFGLFSALACIVKEGMAPFVEVIVNCMVNSAQSTEGVIVSKQELFSASSCFS